MYTKTNFRTKKDLKAAVARGEQVRVYSPGPFPCPDQGTVFLEGPHYPKPHSWYAKAELIDGLVVRME